MADVERTPLKQYNGANYTYIENYYDKPYEDKEENEGIVSQLIRKAITFLACTGAVAVLSLPAYRAYFDAKESFAEQTIESDIDKPEAKSEAKPKTEEQKFIDEISPYAIKTQKKYGVYASVTIAQAIIESGWGKDVLPTKYNNYFGVKKSTDWGGETVWLNTPNDAQKRSEFKVYESIQESFDDHGKLIGTSSRYGEAKNEYDEKKGAKAQVHEIAKAGYAESPVYEQTIGKIIDEYDLQQYDTGAINTKSSEDLVKLLEHELGNGDSEKYCKPFGYPKGTAWCGLFLMWGAKELEMEDQVFTNASVWEMVKYYKGNDKFVEGTNKDYKPKRGDIITFNWASKSGTYDHVGIVTNYDEKDGIVYYLGGNQGSNHEVTNSNIKYGSSEIIGYCQPDYSTSQEKSEEKTSLDVFEKAEEIRKFILEKGSDLMDNALNFVGIEQENDNDNDNVNDNEDSTEIIHDNEYDEDEFDLEYEDDSQSDSEQQNVEEIVY